MSTIVIEMANRPTGELVLTDGSVARAHASYRLQDGTAQNADGLPQTHVSVYALDDASLLPPTAGASGERVYMLAPVVGRTADGAEISTLDLGAGDLFVVQASALPGEDQAFVAFYSETHLGELLALDGYEACVLYRPGPSASHGFVSLWRLSDATVAKASLAAARERPGTIAANAASDRTVSRSGFYERM